VGVLEEQDVPMRDLLAEAAQRAIDYLQGLDRRGVAPTREALARLAEFDVPLPHAPQAAAETLRQLDEIASPATLASAGGRYFGFVIGGALPVTVASNWLATAWDQNAALHAPAPATAVIERTALRWLLELLGLPADAGGAFVTGATMANFSALAAARHAVLQRVGWQVEADGLFGAPPITVLVGEEAHPTLIKSLGLLGLGRSRVLRVPVDGQGRMRAERLPAWSGPCIVCTQAGNINTGAFDPFAAIVDEAHSRGAWVHVDGAFGLWAAASPALAPLVGGVQRADSWATDAHKWLNVPYDSGLAFVRDAAALRAAMSISADYLPTQGDSRNPADFTPELSRRARGVDVWAALRTLGRSGVAEMVERCCRHARRFADELGRAGCTVLNDVVLNQVLVRFADEITTRRVIADLQADGTCWCGPTHWQGHVAMRISVCSWATTDDDVSRSLEAMLRIAARHRA
jgi:glutamate/tyrosine decarboxylase-like PLP-dependent enzyme